MEKEKERMSRKEIPRSNKGSYPWLVYPTKHKQFFCHPILSHSDSDSDSKCRPRIRSIPALKGTIISSSSFGGTNWFLSYEYPSHLSIWNQTSSCDTITLPLLQENYNTNIGSSILWFSPTLTKGLVLLFHSTEQSIIFCKFDINNVGEAEAESGWSWSIRPYGETMRQFFGDAYAVGLLEFPVYYNGEIYTVYYRGLVIIKVDVDGEFFFESTNYKLPDMDGIGCKVQDYFFESLGDLIAIYFSFGGVRYNEIIYVAIYKLDFESNDWKRVVNSSSFKDRVIFLGDFYSISCLTNNQDVGGRVFFTRFRDRSLYSFNIEDESLTFTLPIPNLPKLWNSPYWIPTIRVEDDHDNDEEEDEDEDENDDENEDHDESGCDYHDDPDDGVSISMYNGSEKLLMPVMVNKETQHPIVVEEEENEEKINYFSKLLLDVVERIITKLGVTDYMNFRTLSKSCKLAAPLTNLPKLETQLSLPPWSIHSIDQSIYILVDPTSNEKYFMKIPEHLINAKIRYSHNGWLLMSNKTSNCMFFYNPFTKDTIRLPDPPQGSIPNPTFGFLSSSSTFSNWVCVGLFTLDPTRTEIYYTKSGEEGWQEVTIENNRNFEPNNNTPVVLYDEEGHGSFYFLGTHGNLGVFRLDLDNNKNEVLWEVLENPKTPCCCQSYESNFLLECGGELVSVFVGEIGKWVSVFKLNRVRMVWERVGDLGNHMLFIGRYSCFSQLATIPSMANKIYFPKFSQDDRAIYFSLNTKRFHYSEFGLGRASEGAAPEFDSFRSIEIKGPLQSGWIPSTSRFS